MKKFYLKKWVECLIVTIQFILFIVLCADSDNFTIFVVSKIIGLILIYINHLILEKYTRLFD